MAPADTTASRFAFMRLRHTDDDDPTFCRTSTARLKQISTRDGRASYLRRKLAPQGDESPDHSHDSYAKPPVILEYISRPVQWEARTLAAHHACLGKIDALKWLGVWGGDEAERILIQALNPDGVTEIAQAWIDGPLPAWADKPESDVIDVIRGRAAIGLAHAQSNQGMEQVRQLYDQACVDRANMNHMPEYFIMLVEAMSIHEWIGSVGIDKHRSSMFTHEYESGIAPMLLAYWERLVQ